MERLWVLSGPGLPCGARTMGDDVLGPAQPGRVWLDMCMMGQHLPQMYRISEIGTLNGESDCKRLGLCPDCGGYGDMGGLPTDLLMAARRLDEVPLNNRCAGCGGSGRTGLRVTIRRDGSGLTGDIRVIPHEYVPPVPFDDELKALFQAPSDMCMVCGNPPDGKGMRGEQIHVEAA